MNKYHTISALILVASIFCVTGCTSICSDQTNELCTKHGTPLITKNAYRVNQDVHITPVREYLRISDNYPKHTELHYSDSRTDIHTIRDTITACPKCDAELKNALRTEKSTEQAAPSNR